MSQDATILATTPTDGTAYTSQLNAALAALHSSLYGPVDPATRPDLYTVSPGTLWWDTSPSPNVLKVRNDANDAWATLLGIDGSPGAALQAQFDSKLSLGGGALTSFLTLHADPTSALHAATKQYVDGVSRPAPLRFNLQGNATVASKLAQAVIEQAAQAVGAELYADTAPVGAALIVTFRRKRTAAADDSRTASIADGQNAASVTFGSPMALQAGDRIQLEVSQVGSTTPGGNDLITTLKLTPP